MRILRAGEMEETKRAVHVAALGLASICFAYNAAAFVKRREPHLALNAIFYGVVALWERHNVEHHTRTIREAR